MYKTLLWSRTKFIKLASNIHHISSVHWLICLIYSLCACEISYLNKLAILNVFSAPGCNHLTGAVLITIFFWTSLKPLVLPNMHCCGLIRIFTTESNVLFQEGVNQICLLSREVCQKVLRLDHVFSLLYVYLFIFYDCLSTTTWYIYINSIYTSKASISYIQDAPQSDFNILQTWLSVTPLLLNKTKTSCCETEPEVQICDLNFWTDVGTVFCLFDCLLVVCLVLVALCIIVSCTVLFPACFCERLLGTPFENQVILHTSRGLSWDQTFLTAIRAGADF